ncbi:inovirus-type Gp2 protein [Pseudomonas aeruginosa]|uniref:YagK/YfjJ domain-containing protein n=1 Tax=Pseudomonas aeruginosa TaxID=287 RepID=UPI002AF82E98|nr:inovirus-type Gp2 protein [Pseudomonas aeruginosa]
MLLDEEFNESLLLDQCYLSSDGEDDFVVILPEVDRVQDMAEVVRLSLAVVCGESFFKNGEGVRGERLTKIGRELLLALRIDVGGLLDIYKGGRLSPYLCVFDKVKRQLSECEGGVDFYSDSYTVSEQVDVVKRAVGAILQEASAAEFKKHVRNCERAVNKNTKSLEEFVDSLFERYSRLLVLRLDIGYSLSYLQSQSWVMSLERVKKDFSVFLRLISRGRLKDTLRGYIWKLEFGPSKQYHYHVMVFLDGAKHQEDIRLCEELGEIWKVKVTAGDGVYFNCNRKKYRYKRNGTGMVAWDDAVKIDNLKWAGKYLVKKDLLIRPNLLDKERMFGKSAVPGPSKKVGRPRKKLGV